MKIERKYWIAGLIGAVTITGAYMYLQVKKVLDYTLKFLYARNVTIKTTGVSADFIYEYVNKANIDITIARQEYEIYINGTYYTTLKNEVPQVLKGGNPSLVSFRLNLDYKDVGEKLKTNYLSLVALPQNVKILVKMKWRVKYGIIPVPISYDWELTLKDILSWYLPKK